MYIRKKVERVKVTPVKSASLCNKCEYNVKKHCRPRGTCVGCELLNNGYRCYCNLIAWGKPCEHFKRRKSSVDVAPDKIEFKDENGEITVKFYVDKYGHLHVERF